MTYPIHLHCRFKTDLVRERTRHLCETALELLHEMADYCEGAGLRFMITDSVSTADEDKALSRVSDEHSTARAFDISIQGWKESDIEEFTATFEKRYLAVAAIGKTTGKPRLIFRHNNGHGAHIHVQVARLFGSKDPLAKPPVVA